MTRCILEIFSACGIKLNLNIATNQIRINGQLEQEMEIAWDCLLVVLVLPFQFLISFEVRFSLLKLLAKENGKMFVQKPYL